MTEKIVLSEKLAQIQDCWNPRILAQVNDTHVKLARLEGEFVWHAHEHEDELFLVLEGRLTMHLRTGDVELGPGELIVVPHGVEHCPASTEGCAVMLVEPMSTLNTGDAQDPRRRDELDRI